MPKNITGWKRNVVVVEVVVVVVVVVVDDDVAFCFVPPTPN